jgi:hypothetical protein
MPCPIPSYLPTPPTLTTLLKELADIAPARAAELADIVQEVETRQRQAREQLAAAELALSLVKPDGSRRAAEEWGMRDTDVNSHRLGLRLIGVDVDGVRRQLERELFLARCTHASGRKPCAACQGTGDGESLEAGTCLVPSSCDACEGAGYVTRRP